MSDLASSTSRAVVDLAVDNQCSPDPTSQADVEHDTLADPISLLYLSQCGGICVVINYTRYIKTLGEVILQWEVVPSLGVMERAHDAMRGIDKAPNRDADTQNPAIREMFGAHDLAEHIIDQVEHRLAIGHILQGTADLVQDLAIQIGQSDRLTCAATADLYANDIALGSQEFASNALR